MAEREILLKLNARADMGAATGALRDIGTNARAAASAVEGLKGAMRFPEINVKAAAPRFAPGDFIRPAQGRGPGAKGGGDAEQQVFAGLDAMQGRLATLDKALQPANIEAAAKLTVQLEAAQRKYTDTLSAAKAREEGGVLGAAGHELGKMDGIFGRVGAALERAGRVGKSVSQMVEGLLGGIKGEAKGEGPSVAIRPLPDLERGPLSGPRPAGRADFPTPAVGPVPVEKPPGVGKKLPPARAEEFEIKIDPKDFEDVFGKAAKKAGFHGGGGGFGWPGVRGADGADLFGGIKGEAKGGGGGGFEGLLGGGEGGAGGAGGAGGMGAAAGAAGAFAAAAVIAKDAIEALGKAAISFAGVASPVTLDKFNMTVADAQGVLGSRLIPVLDIMTEGVRDVADVFQNLLPSGDDVREVMDELRPTMDEIKTEFLDIAPVIKETFVVALHGAARGLHLLNDAIKPFLKASEKLRHSIGLKGSEDAESSVGAAARGANIITDMDQISNSAIKAAMESAGSIPERQLDKLNTIAENSSYLKQILQAIGGQAAGGAFADVMEKANKALDG